MVLIVAVMVLALSLGALLGRRLAGAGITAENALTGRQGLAYAVLGALALAGAAVYFAPRLGIVPIPIQLYAEALVWHAARALAAGALGLLVALEWPGRGVPKRLAGLAGGGAILAAGGGFLLYRALPITGLILEPAVHEGVVFQTTAYSCAAASIATLARVHGDSTMSEAGVVPLAGTSREGTSTLGELRAMRALGLAPRFARGLTAESLAAAGAAAVLHVDEPVGAATIRHAVALLAVDTAARTITIGNPLHGRQVRRWSDLPGYWTGEAVLATGVRLP